MSLILHKMLWLVYILQILLSSVTLTKCETTGVEIETKEEEWWKNALVYQIWPRAFRDTDGNGEGDLKGIIEKLGYVKELGADAILICPIYSSPLIDGGFDVDNYLEINPLFGNSQDFDSLITAAHELGLKVMLDMIPNHSSDEHSWFRLSIEKRDHYTDYYIWSGAKEVNDSRVMAPNNWMSVYNNDKEGSAWTWNDQRKEWYYHKFHSSQPDLNLRNPVVVKAILKIFDSWLEKGVDGFRINSVPYLFEDEKLRDEKPTGSGNYTRGLSESIEFLYVIRNHVSDWVKSHNATSKLLVAETDDVDENLIKYYGNGTHRGISPINIRFIDPINNSTSASYIKSVIDRWMKALPKNAVTNWMLSNHDYSRVPTRISLNRVDGLHMLQLLLPGRAFTYYGEEIAMLDSKISWEETIDPMACARTKDNYELYSRDPARTPMQWNDQVSAGFSTNRSTYLPLHPDYRKRNVEYQLKKDHSNLKIYRKLARLRKQRVFIDGDYELIVSNNDDVLVMKRSIVNQPVYIVIVNLSLKGQRVNLTDHYPNLNDTLDIIVASSNAGTHSGKINAHSIKLTANAALVVKGEITETETTTTTTTMTTTTRGSTTTDNTTTETSNNTVTINDTTETSSDTTPTSATSTGTTNTTSTDATNTTNTDATNTTSTDITNTSTGTVSTTSTVTETTLTPETSTVSSSSTTDVTTEAASTDSTENATAKNEGDEDNSATKEKSLVTLVLSTTVVSVLLFFKE